MLVVFSGTLVAVPPLLKRLFYFQHCLLFTSQPVALIDKGFIFLFNNLFFCRRNNLTSGEVTLAVERVRNYTF